MKTRLMKESNGSSFKFQIKLRLEDFFEVE